MSKTLKSVREGTEEIKILPIIIDESTLAEEDTYEDALLALNHLSVMTDDLYSVIGNDEIKIDSNEITAILNSYELISEIYEKHESIVSMPSKEYDLDDLDVEVMEEIDLQLTELSEMVGDDNVLSHRVPAKELAVLDKLGFKEAKPGKETWMSSQYKVKKMWGIPMRAGKWADIFFAVLDDNLPNKDDKKIFIIIDSDGTTRYTDVTRAIGDLKKMAKMNETIDDELNEATYSFMNKMSGKVRKIKANNDADAIKKMNTIHPISDDALKSAKVTSVDQWFKKYYKIFKEEAEMNETPDRYGSQKSKIKASIASFQKKLDSGKFPDSEADIKKIISRLEAELKKFNEDIELEEGNLIDMVGKTCSKCEKGKYKDDAPDGGPLGPAQDLPGLLAHHGMGP
jgi:hypothetical protein